MKTVLCYGGEEIEMKALGRPKRLAADLGRKQDVASLPRADVGRKRSLPKFKPDTPRRKFAFRLHALAGKRTMREIAAACGTSTETVSKWFAGENLPDLNYWPKLAKALGLRDYRDLLPPV